MCQYDASVIGNSSTHVEMEIETAKQGGVYLQVGALPFEPSHLRIWKNRRTYLHQNSMVRLSSNLPISQVVGMAQAVLAVGPAVALMLALLSCLS